MLKETHQAALADCCRDAALGARILAIHSQLAGFCPAIRRIAVAVYDPGTQIVRTFLRSASGVDDLTCYERPLREVPSLQALAVQRQPRIIDDLATLAGSTSEHTLRILASGYESSFTVPLFSGTRLLGFLFFDADRKSVFTSPLVSQLMVYSQLIALLVAQDRTTVNTLLSAVRTAMHFSRFRDEETGAHLARMSHYAKVIAAALPPTVRPGDEYIEYLLHFAPLHDVGKIAVSDGILHKPGTLTEDERAIMRTHVDHGASIIDAMLDEFGLGELHHVPMLRNIILHHHENFDGTGYGKGLAGQAIPLEARIVKVADVFDALTSHRPYKAPWSVDDAFAYLVKHAGTQFDPVCVNALVAERDTVMLIRDRFQDIAEPEFAAAH